MRRLACLAGVLALSACALPPKLEILNAGPSPISVGLDYHSKTVEPGGAFAALYSGKDFTVTEGGCLFRYRGLKRGSETLKLRWSGAGRLEAGSSLLPAVSRRCATEPEPR